MSRQAVEVLRMVDRLGTCTSQDVVSRFMGAESASGVRTRLRELYSAGYVEVTDRFGLSPTGRKCNRYHITPKGMMMLDSITPR